MVIKLDNTFVPGDMVVLKSGGPKMTVESVGIQYREFYAECVFFDKNVLKRMSFDPAVLTKLGDGPAISKKVAPPKMVF
jgi:uncharacterized protein YodC (DUF2158 family)